MGFADFRTQQSNEGKIKTGNAKHVSYTDVACHAKIDMLCVAYAMAVLWSEHNMCPEQRCYATN